MDSFKIDRKDELIEIGFTVNLVGSTVEELREILKKIISVSIKKLVLNFIGVEMIDSMGIGLLVSTHNAMIERNSEMEIINLSKDLYELFSVMQLHDALVLKEK